MRPHNIRPNRSIQHWLLAVLVGFAMLFSAFEQTTPASAAAGTNTLYMNERLYAGDRLISDGGQYHLVMQTDGNLVIYAPNNVPIWATGTNGRDGAYLSMQDDGNLVIYQNGVAYWATGTNGNRDARLVMQGDGNLVLYTPEWRPLWSSKGGLVAAAIQPVTGKVTGVMSNRCTRYDWDHYGVDIGAPSGAPIVATAAGKVSYVGGYGAGGMTVKIQHSNGYESIYMHMSKYASAVGQVKAKGAVIGYVGSTGISSGPHLHFEMRKNGAVVNLDPAYDCYQNVTQGTNINQSFPGI